MPSQKEILAELLDETGELSRALESNSDVSENLCSELEELRSDISTAYRDIQHVTDVAIDRFDQRLESFRRQLGKTLEEGAHQMREEMISGAIVGNVIGGALWGLIGGAINQAI